LESLVRNIESRLQDLKTERCDLGALTFAGNGEPTLHPEFPPLIDQTLELRDRFFPEAVVVVLTNATELVRESVRTALQRVDEACMKLDAGSDATFKRINLPHGKVRMRTVVDALIDFPSPIVQTMFVRGTVDNTGEEEIESWLNTLERIEPRRVDIYSLDRTAPDPDLEAVPLTDLQVIAALARDRLAVPVTVF